MGRSTAEKHEQIQYVQARLKLISEMAGSLSEEASSADLENVLVQLDNLKIKLVRFKKDWEKKSD